MSSRGKVSLLSGFIERYNLFFLYTFCLFFFLSGILYEKAFSQEETLLKQKEEALSLPSPERLRNPILERLLSHPEKAYKRCLEKVETDPEKALEEALVWQGRGGGVQARHCVAAALLARGYIQEAAIQLEEMAELPQVRDFTVRAEFLRLSTDAWLLERKPENALKTIEKALLFLHRPGKVQQGQPYFLHQKADLLERKARALILLQKWKKAEQTLSEALALQPEKAGLYRERARVLYWQKNLPSARQDLERALRLDPENIETLVLRGKIKEAFRKQKR